MFMTPVEEMIIWASEHGQLSGQILLPSSAGNASAVSFFPESTASEEEPQEDASPTTDHAESTASGEEPREDTSPATDIADVSQQPDMLLFKGSQHITPLPVSTVERKRRIANPESSIKYH
ncbi:hypothetical protein O3P69_002655 [Scylla paramamosain]|uniref:Uncharacterized protein n=1 Tax=Scylla paramamosain TaxID=85552 RepID=A0AAW0ULM6_SCYPA